MVRIRAKDLGDPDNVDEQIILDLVIVGDGKVAWKFPTYGCRGLPKINPSNFWPFALLKDGSLLQAHEPADPGEIGERINIIGKTISIGQLFTYSTTEDEFTYQITHITPFEEIMK